MKKITDFIINKRYLILIVFIVFSVISVILSNKVNINNDITKYLPSTSDTRIGLDIMEKEFPEEDTSSLNLMFKGLTEEEKDKIYKEISNINDVSSVDYDNTEDYNKDDYTLYTINVDDKSESETATKVYNEIEEKYKDYETYTSGAISESNTPILPTWIIVVAITCALIVLIIACESYVEPFLFLTVILIAVILNSGTNVIFDNVSNITSSISAILQMALSMDYSIMLMNRFRQEKETEKDKVKAMKSALYNAFKSISSSSLTTIVGLLALVFMSFTIGRDLGLVLAKGVLLSLLTIFFVLPTLILVFDKLIEKTKKRSFNFKLNKLGSFSHKLRYPITIIFVLAFIGSYMIKGNLGILFTDSELDEIGKVFGENNQIAVVYKNEDEEKMAKNLNKIEDKEKVDSVLAYGNTINEKLDYKNLNEKLEDLGSDVSIEDYILKILYYKYYNPKENNTMTIEELYDFIKKEVYNNKDVKDTLSDEEKDNIEKLKYFTKKEEINKKRTSSEIANILDISKQDVKDILIYYNSKNNNLKLTVGQFVKFINNDVLTDKKYSKNINKDAKNSLKQLTKFTNKNTIKKKMTSDQMANLFGMPKNTVKDLYTYYISVNDIKTKLKLSEFADFVLTDVATDKNYSNSINKDTLENVKMLKTFSDKKIINKNMTAKELSKLSGIDENAISQLLLLKYKNTDNGTTLSIPDFVNQVIEIKNNTNYLKDIDKDTLNNLKLLQKAMDDSNSKNSTKYTASQMSKILNVNKNQMYNLYALIDFSTGNTAKWKITPKEFVTLILENKENENIKKSINKETLGKLTLLSKIMESATNNTKYNYKELSKFIGIDNSTLKGIYTLYVSKNSTTKLMPTEFVDFILKHKKDELLAKNLNDSTIDTLKLLQKVMISELNGTKYSSKKISSLLGMEKDSIDLLYGLYVTKYERTNQTISLKKLTDFILDDVMKNSNYSSSFDTTSKNKLQTVRTIMNASLNGTKYNKDKIFAILSNIADSLDKNTIELLYLYYGSANEYNPDWKMTVEEFVGFLNEEILPDNRFEDFIEKEEKQEILDSKKTVNDAKDLLVGDEYSRIVINTKLDYESDETFAFIRSIKDILGNDSKYYIAGDSAMAYEMSGTFSGEFDFISVLTMIAIFIVVAITFKSIILPLTLVLTIQCAVYVTMGYLSLTGGTVYFIAILIVQSILMGATIDYAIVYTSYYQEYRRQYNIKEAIINAYNQSIHTILTSASILIIVTFIVGHFATAITAKICKTLAEGTICSLILILFLLPGVLATFDKLIIKKKNNIKKSN